MDKEFDFYERDNDGNIMPFPHSNCRCSIITKPEEIYFTYVTKYLINEYLEENQKGLWIN
jgi:hypothetical protein